MSEQAPAQQQDDQAQIDLKAAQKAKAYLEDGVEWGDSYVGDNQAKVKVFPEGTSEAYGVATSTASDAMDKIDFINHYEDEIKEAEDAATLAKLRADDAWQAKDLALQAAKGAEDETFQSSAAYDALEKNFREKKDKESASYREISPAKSRRDAALWQGRQDYLGDQAGYQINAIQDATAAGHEINFGGHTFPAGEPVNPQHYEQKIQSLQQEQQAEPREPQLQ